MPLGDSVGWFVELSVYRLRFGSLVVLNNNILHLYSAFSARFKGAAYCFETNLSNILEVKSLNKREYFTFACKGGYTITC